jgi:hypothetical protein
MKTLALFRLKAYNIFSASYRLLVKGGENVAQKAYFGLAYIISLILAIIPGVSMVCGILVRVQREQYLFAILNFLLFPIFWVIDLISMLVNKDLEWLA